jgi:DNA mismatch repair protein MLH3
VFELTEKGIPSLSLTSAPLVETGGLSRSLSKRAGAGVSASCFEVGQHPGIAITRRFAKEELRNALVINQVDRKFIACSVAPQNLNDDGEGHHTIILVDQHAADERIRVERFLSELCFGFLQENVARRALEPPFPVLLTRLEIQALLRPDHVYAFDRWGFGVVVPEATPSSFLEATDDAQLSGEYVQAFFDSVPDIVGDKVM